MPLLPAALVAALLSYVMPVSPPGMAQAGLLAASGLLIFTAALLGAGRVRSQAIALLRAGRGAA
ncbi:MAG: hypothetical protein MUC44_15310, partial [Beijerinckiaceae bacterium]|nr:hypothetical protein [Beijerinckiaceae bacterium]